MADRADRAEADRAHRAHGARPAVSTAYAAPTRSAHGWLCSRQLTLGLSWWFMLWASRKLAIKYKRRLGWLKPAAPLITCVLAIVVGGNSEIFNGCGFTRCDRPPATRALGPPTPPPSPLTPHPSSLTLALGTHTSSASPRSLPHSPPAPAPLHLHLVPTSTSTSTLALARRVPPRGRQQRPWERRSAPRRARRARLRRGRTPSTWTWTWSVPEAPPRRAACRPSRMEPPCLAGARAGGDPPRGHGHSRAQGGPRLPRG